MPMTRSHAYLILAHDNAYVLRRLLSLIDDDRSTIFIDLDRRFVDADEAGLAPACTRSPVHRAPPVPALPPTCEPLPAARSISHALDTHLLPSERVIRKLFRHSHSASDELPASHRFFARKFRADVDREIVDRLGDEVASRRARET